MLNVEKEKITPEKECPIPNGQCNLRNREQVSPLAMETTAGKTGSARTVTVCILERASAGQEKG